jgi:hypothetical protein
MSNVKPLGMKSYGHIPHLPGSRVGPGDHTIGEQQGAIATAKSRKDDRVIVQEKLDGSNVAVANIGGEIVPLIRAGYRAADSIREQHHRFNEWATVNRSRFANLLKRGERVCGEWMMQAHGTLYSLPHEPFVVFDIMTGIDRLRADVVRARAHALGFTTPHVISDGPAFSIASVIDHFDRFGSAHGAIGPVEGAVWRVETDGAVNFLCKWVRPDKNDRKFLRDASDNELPPTWNEWKQ